MFLGGESGAVQAVIFGLQDMNSFKAVIDRGSCRIDRAKGLCSGRPRGGIEMHVGAQPQKDEHQCCHLGQAQHSGALGVKAFHPDASRDERDGGQEKSITKKW